MNKKYDNGNWKNISDYTSNELKTNKNYLIFDECFVVRKLPKNDQYNCSRFEFTTTDEEFSMEFFIKQINKIMELDEFYGDIGFFSDSHCIRFKIYGDFIKIYIYTLRSFRTYIKKFKINKALFFKNLSILIKDD